VHGVPQAPQWAAFVIVSTQAPPHTVWPGVAQAQVPALHVLPPGQELLHVPQCVGDVVTSTQLVPHVVTSEAHVIEQTPCEQTSPIPHAVPHPPQCCPSDWMSTHAAPHAVSAPVQAQADATHA